MGQKQIAFEKTRLEEALYLSDISPKWAKRLGEQQQKQQLSRPKTLAIQT
jgi:hypothetical protein